MQALQLRPAQARLSANTPISRGCVSARHINGLSDLMAHGMIGDWRETDVIRISPPPLYNRHADCLAFSEAVQAWSHSG
jgi:kynureninase